MSGWFGGNSSRASTEPVYNGVQLTQSTYGIPITLCYGMTKVPAFLLQYEDFTVTAHSDSSGGGKGGGGGSGSSSNTYSAAIVLGLCEGPGVSVGTVYNDKQQVALGDPSVNLTLFSGASGQAPWSYLTTNHPTRADGYDLTAYVANGNFQLGSSAGLPNLLFETKALTQFAPLSGVFDAEPSAVIIDYTSDPNHGADYPYLGDVSQLQAYCLATGILISPAEQTQRQASDFLGEILQIANSEPIWSQGTTKVIPRGDETVVGSLGTFTPNLTPLFSFTDDDYVVVKEGDDPIKITRQRPADNVYYNCLRVEFLDRSNQYNAAIAEATIDLDIIENGRRPMQSITFHEITTPAVARFVAQLILNRQFYIRNIYTFTVTAMYAGIEAMDVLELNDSKLGLANTLVRATKVTHGTPDKRNVTIEAEELPLGPGGAPLYNWELGQGYAANYAVSPGSVNTPLMFNGPPSLVGVNGGYELWIAVSGGVNWGGCNVYASLDNLKYEYVSTVTGASKYGTLTAALAAGVGDPDTTHTLSVLLNDTTLAIPPSTTNEADALRELMWVDGEVIAYGAASQTGIGTYAITYMHRGLYQSDNVSHASGTNFAKLDTGILRVPIDPGFTGQTIYFKFASFNSFQKQVQDLSVCTAYPKTLTANDMGGTLPGNAGAFTGNGVTIIGNAFFKTGSTNAYDADAFSQQPFQNGCALTWRAGDGAYAMGLDQNPTSTIDNTSIDFAFRYTVGGSLFIDESGVQVGSAVGSVSTNDIFEIRYDGVTIHYYQNGILLRAVRASGLTLFCKWAAHDAGSVVTDVLFSATTSVGIVGGNMMPSYPWTVGNTGNQNNFAQIVTNSGGSNSIILGDGSSLTSPLGPFQTTEPLWKSVGGTTGAGLIGWRDAGDLFGLDSTKSYRFSVWMRWTGSGTTGSFQFGVDSGLVKNLSPGTVDSDPAFVFGRFPLIASDQWFLVVGIIHGSGYTGAQSGISGLYDPTTGDRVQTLDGFSNGSNVAIASDFKFVAGGNDVSVNVLSSNTSSTSTIMFTCRPRFDEINGNEPSIASLMAPAAVDPSLGPGGHVARHGILARGNIPPSVQDNTFTYTSNTSSLEWIWSAYKVYRADGNSFTVTANNQNVTGLSAGTSYFAYPYVLEAAPTTIAFNSGGSGAVGTPAIDFPASATYSQLAAALAAASVIQAIFQGKLTGATTSSGTGGGGGGGGGFGCLHPSQSVETPQGRVRAATLGEGDRLYTPAGTTQIRKLTRPIKHEWITVDFDNGERVIVTADHRFITPSGQMIPASRLRCTDIIAGSEMHLQIRGLRYDKFDAEAVSIELDSPHLYLTSKRGPISHNLKP